MGPPAVVKAACLESRSGFEAHSRIQVSKKQNVSSLFIRKE